LANAARAANDFSASVFFAAKAAASFAELETRAAPLENSVCEFRRAGDADDAKEFKDNEQTIKNQTFW
jgi:hypothetical protein